VKIVQPSVSLEWITENALQMIERAGRTCYKSEDRITDDSATQFAGMIKQRGHASVVEHACASFRIICDRGVSHEIVRHRIASYSQESTRYCNYAKEKFGNEISVIVPPGIEACKTNTDLDCQCDKCRVVHQWFFAMEEVERTYINFVKQGMSPQIARSILPNCLKTELVMTANFREWLHFLDLRTSVAAHPQMREIAGMIEDILVKECPVIFKKKEQ
jgi:thymidylate synthase (FAD)